jgi:hypothetical protein
MIRPITSEQFHRLFKFPRWHPLSPAAMVHALVKETQWLADEDKTQLGVILYDRGDKDWPQIFPEPRWHDVKLSSSESDEGYRSATIFGVRMNPDEFEFLRFPYRNHRQLGLNRRHVQFRLVDPQILGLERVEQVRAVTITTGRHSGSAGRIGS